MAYRRAQLRHREWADVRGSTVAAGRPRSEQKALHTGLFPSPPVFLFDLDGTGRRRQRLRADVLGRALPGDRKSTRLNSSHSQISYAVFCLKKKKKSNIMSVHANL